MGVERQLFSQPVYLVENKEEAEERQWKSDEQAEIESKYLLNQMKLIRKLWRWHRQVLERAHKRR